MSNFHNYEWATLEVKRARDKNKGKKLQNNTYMRELADGSFAVKLHAVDVVIIHADGTYTLRNGGWNTPTTLDRIRRYSPVSWSLYSERGDWFVKLEPTDRDPRPENVERSIPRPFEASNPGDEPVKDTEDCKAGQMVAVEHVNEIVRVFRKDMKEGDVLLGEDDPKGDRKISEYDFVDVERSWTSHIYYSESQYWDEAWSNLPDNNNPWSNSFVNDDGERVRRIQCPHCAEFDAIHERWKRAYEGGKRYGRSAIDQQKGYKTYVIMMERFDGDVDAWQEAYITDFRARRAYLKADREWVERNRVPFYDGIVVDSEGYAPRIRRDGPSPAKLRRHEREIERIKKQIDTYIDGYIKALQKGMPMPSGGDCWYCCMFDAVPANDSEQAHKRGKSVEPGSTLGNDHLFEHMKERYYVPSLAVNALRDRGYKDIGVAILLGMDPEANTMGGNHRVMVDSVRRDLRRYLRNRLVPTAPTE